MADENKEQHALLVVTQNYRAQCTSIETSIPLALYAEASSKSLVSKAIDEILSTEGAVVDHPKDGKRKYIHLKIIAKFKKLIDRQNRTNNFMPIYLQSILIYSVANFDQLIANTMRYVFKTHPGMLTSTVNDDASKANNRSIDYKKLREFKNISEIHEYMINREIDLIMRKSHEEIFKTIKGLLKIDIAVILENYLVIMEIFERRNLYTHTGGYVSDQYINACAKYDFPNEIRANQGEIAILDRSYIEKAIESLYFSGIIISHCIWNRSIDSEGVLESLSIHIYESVAEEKYEIAIKMADFAITSLFNDKTNHDQEMVIILNKAQCLKWMGKNQECENFINKYSNKIVNDTHVMAKNVLFENFDEAARVWRTIGQKDTNLKSGCHEWPIFKEFRKTNIFVEVYKEIYGEDFEQMNYPLSEEQMKMLRLV